MSIEELYTETLNNPCDVQGHLRVLRELASQCRHVTEFGVRSGYSTTALLAAQPEVLECYDIAKDPRVNVLAANCGRTHFIFHNSDVLVADITPTDMLFIDTKHTGAQVYAELTRHGDKVRRWLVFHDTVTCGIRDPYYPDEPGLMDGILRYMMAHPDWRLVKHYPHSHGLDIWERTP